MRNTVSARVWFAAVLVGFLAVGNGAAEAAGACKLVPNDRGLPGKILVCGENLTIRPAQGARYKLFYEKGRPLPAGARLDNAHRNRRGARDEMGDGRHESADFNAGAGGGGRGHEPAAQ